MAPVGEEGGGGGSPLEELLVRVVGLLARGGLPGGLVHRQHVARDALVVLGVAHVLHDEDEVEAGEDGALQLDVLARGLEVVVAAGGRVGGGEHGGAGVEHGGDARLGDRDRLLLHGFVDGDAVLLPHLVKLVDAHDAVVRQHHRAALQVEVAAAVLDDGGSQTRGGGALAGGVHGDGRHAGGKFEELRLGGGGVSQQQHVDVAPQAGAVRHALARAGKEEARHRALDVLVPKDLRRDLAVQLLGAGGRRGEVLKLALLLHGEGGHGAAVSFGVLFQADHAQVRLAHRNSAGLVLQRRGKRIR
mmetsp:Transcript_47934/g.120039  ORF Transcript_47934/g.120039 Transcript_47934/m.120039 type:complete len:303 (-) Transcript_47934:3-911(-)